MSKRGAHRERGGDAWGASALVAGGLLVGLALLMSGCGSRTGLKAYTEDAEVRCSPTNAEICNGADDDCDGIVDEGVPPIDCGEGPCRTQIACENGRQIACVPRVPTDEICNVEDDDCDGRVDEGFGFGPLAEPEVVRWDEFDTGPCTTCSWAFGTTLTPASGGFYAYWNLAIYGGRERPNYFRRRLDSLGRPMGPIEFARDDYILRTYPVQSVGSLPALGTPLQAVFRVGVDDIPGILFVNGAGESRTVTSPQYRGTGGALARLAWAGERLVHVELTRDLRILSYAPDGSDYREESIGPSPSGPGKVSVAVYQDRIGVLRSTVLEDDEREHWLYILEPDGSLISRHAITTEYQSQRRLIAVADGWVTVVAGGLRQPTTWQKWTLDGTPLTDVMPFEDERIFAGSEQSEFYFTHPETGRVLIIWSSPYRATSGILNVEIRDSAWDVVQAWSGPLPEMLTDGDRFAVGVDVAFTDRGFVAIWHGLAPDRTPNQIYSQAFGCTPGESE